MRPCRPQQHTCDDGEKPAWQRAFRVDSLRMERRRTRGGNASGLAEQALDFFAQGMGARVATLTGGARAWLARRSQLGCT